MPILLYILMFFIILSYATSLLVSKSNDHKELNDKFTKEQVDTKYKNVQNEVISFYNRYYSEIHQNYEPSEFIKILSNDDGPIDEYILFNRDNVCVFKKPLEDNNNDEADDNRKSSPLIKEFKDNHNKNLNCSSMNIDTLTSYLPTNTDIGEDEGLNEQKLLKDLLNIVTDRYYIRIGKELIKEYKTIVVPVLSIYLYDISQLNKPKIMTEVELNTEKIVFDKIDEAKLMLDQIANLINEYGKRQFKGLEKLKNYSNFNAFTNLAEAIEIEEEDNGLNTKKVYRMISQKAESGFQTSNFVAFNTKYMKSNTQNLINSIINSSWDSGSYCSYRDASFQEDNSLNWSSNNSYYGCNIIDKNNNYFGNKIKPSGYCNLEDKCTLEYTFDNKGRIETIKSSSLEDYLVDKIGLDVNLYYNPFFPNQKINKYDNFILSSSNGNVYLDFVNMSLNLGLKIINRDDDRNILMGGGNVDYSKNYIINKYHSLY